MLSEAISSGVPELDDALGGLLWGDNVVWEVEEGASAEPFYRAAARSASEFDFAAYVTLTRGPDDLATTYPGLQAIDGRPGGRLGHPGPLLTEIRRICSQTRRDLILFDPIDVMAERWGAETAKRFFVRACPLLLDLGAIAYWSIGAARANETLRQEIGEIAQCVLSVGQARLRIGKAEGRAASVQGSMFRLRVVRDAPVIEPAPAVSRLGASLRALRLRRSLSQTELARLAGVSASAVSQAERGLRGLSLETLIELGDRLGITLDELLRGDATPGYRLARRVDPHRRAEGVPTVALDDPRAGMRAYVVRLPPRSSSTPGISHDGVQLLALSGGLVQLVLSHGRPVLRDRETILLDPGTAVVTLRNLSEREATIFWVVRD